MSLDLYAKIEPYLGFEDEVKKLHNIFLDKLIELNAKKVLDIGCGSGEFLLKAEERGIDIEGIDLSSEMVKRAAKKGAKAYCKDLCKVDKKYDAAVAIFDVVNYLNKKELKKFLCCASNVLKEGGYFICDINTLHGFEDIAEGSVIIDKNDIFFAIDAEFRGDRLKTDINLFQKRDSSCYEKESGSITQYYHSVEELKSCKNLKLEDIDFISLFSDLPDKAILTYAKEWNGTL